MDALSGIIIKPTLTTTERTTTTKAFTSNFWGPLHGFFHPFSSLKDHIQVEQLSLFKLPVKFS